MAALKLAILFAGLVVALTAACTGDQPTHLPSTATPDGTAVGMPSPTPSLVPAETPTGTPAMAPSPEPAAIPTTAAPTETAAPEPTAAHAYVAQVVGDWAGNTLVAQSQLELSVSLAVSGGVLHGTIDIPSQGAFGLELAGVAYEEGRLHFELDSPIGIAVWDGEVREDAIEGEFTQAGLQGTFRLKRAEGPTASGPGPGQESAAYLREEVSFSNGEIVLAGDLTFPDSAAPHPAVVLISGSGGQDRDTSFYGFKVFEVLANLIAAQGIAVLRFDDRGIGGSTGEWPQATLHDRASDVAAAVAWLEAREDLDRNSIGLVGHSEGGLVAGIVANQVDGIAYLGLLASPAVRGDELLRAQQRMIMEVGGAGPKLVEQAQAYQQLALRAVATREGWDAVESSARALVLEQLEALPEAAQGSIANTEKYVDGMVARQLMALQSPWFRSFVEYDPRPHILALDVPVLALFGTHDTQVPADQNSTAMSEAFADSSIPSHALATIWPANHLFQEAVTGNIDEYAVLNPEFVPDFLEFLLDWLAMQTARP